MSLTKWPTKAYIDMITADKIEQYGKLTTEQLVTMIRQHYPQDSFLSSKFLGITNGQEFCYSVTYTDPDYEQPQQTKVFVDVSGDADY